MAFSWWSAVIEDAAWRTCNGSRGPQKNAVEGLVHLSLAARMGRQRQAIHLMKVIRKYHESKDFQKEIWESGQMGHGAG
jgi:hypothetical protein